MCVILVLTLLFITPLIRLILTSLNMMRFLTSFMYRGLTQFIKHAPRPTSPTVPAKLWLSINRGLGLIEYGMGSMRNITLGLAITVLWGTTLYQAFGQQRTTVPVSFHLLALVVLGLILSTRHHYTTSSLRIAEYLRSYPQMHPGAFFQQFVQLLGGLPYQLPEASALPDIDPKKLSFKYHERAKQRLMIFFRIVWDTTHLAHIALKCHQCIGPEYAREIFDHMAAMWGKRMLQIFQASFQLTGLEKVTDLEGKNILVFNHKSQLDYTLSFFALSTVKLKHRFGFRPRFITAKDHFVDNPIAYEIIGVGKLIEAVDMVFIDRRTAKQGVLDLKQAAEFLVKKDIDIAIFPQGTRSEGNIDRSLKRRDSGYYSTCSPKHLGDDHAHLKKGCAFLAIDTLMELQKRSVGTKLNLVFIGIQGTGIAFPKGSLRIQTETDLAFHIGSVLTLSPTQVAGLQKPTSKDAPTDPEKNFLIMVNSLHEEIDRRLASAIDLHEQLRHRFLVDLKGHFRYPADRIQLAEKHLDTISARHNIIYQILDRIYALKHPNLWNPYLSELAQILMEGSNLERFKILRSQVTEHLMASQHVKKRHGKKLK